MPDQEVKSRDVAASGTEGIRWYLGGSQWREERCKASKASHCLGGSFHRLSHGLKAVGYFSAKILFFSFHWACVYCFNFVKTLLSVGEAVMGIGAQCS